MGREGWRRKTAKRTSKDMAAAQWLFEGSGLLRGGTCRRLMVGDHGGEVKGTEEEVESRPLWRAAITHLLTPLEQAVVATGLSPQPGLPEGLTRSLSLHATGGNTGIATVTNTSTCTCGSCSSARQVLNSRWRGGWAHGGPNKCVCTRVSVSLAYRMWICMHYVHASADEPNPPDYDFAQLHS